MTNNKNVVAYKRHLEKSFTYIANNDIINENCSNLTNYARSILSKLKSSRETKWSYKIDPPWLIPILRDRNFRKDNASLLLGGIMSVDESQLKYSFSTTILVFPTGETPDFDDPLIASSISCCERYNYDKNIAIRRFHLDVSEGVPKILEPKSHLHLGGYIYQEEYDHIQNLHYCGYSSIAIPRFPNPPLDFVLLIDFLLRQFNTIIEKRFVEDPNWRNIVKMSEKFRLEQYYISIMKYFEIKNNRTLFETMCHKEFKI